MRNFLRSRYPKLILLVVIIIVSYLVFSNPAFDPVILKFANLGSFSFFIAGMLLAFSFTAPLAVGLFLALNPQNIFLAALIAGIGAVIADLIIFSIIRFSFMKEYNRLKNTKTFRLIEKEIAKEFHHKMRVYLLYIFAEIMIASPLPDEIGVNMLAGLTSIKESTFALLSFGLHFLGILILLSF